jgi:hypothetical protein
MAAPSSPALSALTVITTASVPPLDLKGDVRLRVDGVAPYPTWWIEAERPQEIQLPTARGYMKEPDLPHLQPHIMLLLPEDDERVHAVQRSHDEIAALMEGTDLTDLQPSLQRTDAYPGMLAMEVRMYGWSKSVLHAPPADALAHGRQRTRFQVDVGDAEPVWRVPERAFRGGFRAVGPQDMLEGEHRLTVTVRPAKVCFSSTRKDAPLLMWVADMVLIDGKDVAERYRKPDPVYGAAPFVAKRPAPPHYNPFHHHGYRAPAPPTHFTPYPPYPMRHTSYTSYPMHHTPYTPYPMPWPMPHAPTYSAHTVPPPTPSHHHKYSHAPSYDMDPSPLGH